MQTLAVFLSPLTQVISKHLLNQSLKIKKIKKTGLSWWQKGNSSDAPPCAILSMPRSWCLMISCGGVADMPAILFPLRLRKRWLRCPLTLQGCESLESVIKYVQSTWLMVPFCCGLSQVVDHFENRQGCYFLPSTVSILKLNIPADDYKHMPVTHILGRTVFENNRFLIY